MKRTFTLPRCLLLCMAAVAGLSLAPVSVCADSEHPVYKITFGARGESSTVDAVLVENLSNGKSATLSGQDTLLLKAKGDLTPIDEVRPSVGDVRIQSGQLVVDMLQPSPAQVSVYGVDGTLAWQTRIDSQSRISSVTLPPLGKGFYVVRVTAPGLERSVKWLSGGSSSLSAPAFITEQEVADESGLQSQEYGPLQPMFAMESASKGVELEFAKGDVLRFTGTSGDMTTITTNSPRSTHPVYFDFFRCQDADGYNYTIVRAGDMLWMAEDLRRVNSLKINDAGTMSSELLTSVIGNPDMPLMASEGNNTYYSKAAAIKALPEGWQLPTQGEIDYAIKKLNGGNYNTAGAYLKGEGEGRLDSTSLRMTANGRFDANGSVVDGSKGYFMTRSTKGGVMLAMQLSGSADKVSVGTCQNHLISVRGVRAAPSAYTEMMETFGYTSQKAKSKARVPATLREKGPLGKTYVMHTGPQSIAYDFTGGQFKSVEPEARSGILAKDSKGAWFLNDRRDADFLSDCGSNSERRNTLRKMAAMNNGEGTQYTLEMQWSRPFRIVTQLVGNSYKRTDTPDVFGFGNVYLTIAGNSQMGHDVIYDRPSTERYGIKLPGEYYFIPLNKSILPYFRYDNNNRPTETRMDYVQRCFQLLTADFNEDGVDEAIVCVDGVVNIYDGATMLNTIKQGKSADFDGKNYLKPSMYYKDFRVADDGSGELDCSAYYLKKPMTRFAVGDVDGDGISDLAVLRVGTGGEKGKAKVELFVYGAGNLKAKPIAYSYFYETSPNAVFNDIKIGNVSGSRYNDIIMLFRNYSGTTLEKIGYMWHAMYDPNNTETHLKIDGNRDNIDSDYVGKNQSFQGYDGHIGNTNITLANFRGPGYPCDIVCGADLWRWNSETEKMEFCDIQVLPFTCNDIWSIYCDNIIAADPNGTGVDILYYFRNWDTYESDNGNRLMFQGFSETWFSSKTEFTSSTLKHRHTFNSDYFKYCDQGSVWNSKDQKDVELMWWFGGGDVEFGNNSALCAVYDRPGYKVLQYKGHETAFSEPRIHALIAAPPTFDYGNETEPNYDFVTSWGFNSKTSQQTTNSSSVSASLIVGFEQEINAPITGTKLGGVEFTTKMEQECTKTTSETSSISYGQIYEARDDDRVVMQVTPYDNYTYEVVASDNVDEIGGLLNLSIPQKPMTVGLALSDYDYLMADNKNAPDLHEVFSHTIGDPFSYPSTADKIKTNVPGSEILWGNGQWNDFVTTGSGGSSIREIALDNSTATSAAFSFSVESELVVTAFCAKVGAGFGYGNTNETTHEESQGFSVSACVPGLAPGDKSPNRSFFDWNLCWYKYKLAGQTFPVVNYVVKKR